MKQTLNGKWRLFNGKYDITADVPGSLKVKQNFTKGLLKNGQRVYNIIDRTSQHFF